MQESSIRVHNGKVGRSPAEAGMDEGRLDELDRFFAGLVQRGRIQAAGWLVARDGHLVVHRSLGRRTHRADDGELRPDAIRPVYSITKVITAVAILMLIEDGKAYLQQPVANWLEPFDTPQHRAISLWHLLTHTSGLAPDPGFDLEPFAKPWYAWWLSRLREQDKAGARTADDDIRHLLAGPLRDEPGRQWLYSTAGYAILAEVIRRASDMPYEQFVAERIFEPLGMTRSFFRVPRALWKETCVVNAWEEEMLRREEDGGESLPPGGNGLYSTLEDLWRFGQAMLDGGSFNGKQLLGRRMVGEMVTNQLAGVFGKPWGRMVPKFDYGLGWSLSVGDLCSPGSFGHEGSGRSLLCIDPAERLVFVCFAPSPIDWVPESVNAPQNLVWSALL